MNSIKCAECGLVNFASATECKRCHVKFHHSEPALGEASSVGETPGVSETGRELTEDNQDKVAFAPLPDYFNDEPAPFSGPVILFAIGLAVTLVVIGSELAVYFTFFNSPTWNLMTDQSLFAVYYTPVLEPLFYLDFIIKSAVFLAALALLLILPGKSWSFIKWVRVYLIAGALYQIAEIVALLSLRWSLTGQQINKPFNVLWEEWFWVSYGLVSVASIIIILAWLTYFSKSKRVQRIFIN